MDSFEPLDDDRFPGGEPSASYWIRLIPVAGETQPALSSGLIFLHLETFQILHIDKRTADILGYPVITLTCRALKDIVHPDDLKNTRSILKRVSQSGLEEFLESRLVTSTGDSIRFSCMVGRREAKLIICCRVREEPQVQPTNYFVYPSS